ncbi:NAD(P)/FAD-dependent oxidoreductase [Ovoidimarina sediminis]|uniref:NAD(P)/FAD-dependent oxidoreductase n=1 Tax=Ovoidimarina sediminis TaxID=3079856 RepID=UPI00290610F3|nr:FAD-binding oxidoreductase [Rhodophyticola sp. MJ-SS7]MDU8944205.1 FAD-binding oxidoreductase [Rhodophyticola sp. MJ-SS7]
MNSESPISLWDASAEEPNFQAPLDGDATADLAIVGGGFTGLSTALYAAEKGLDAFVLEARQIGYGGSGRNVGLVNAGVWHPPAAVRKALGDTYGPRFIRRFSDGPAQVFSLIERHQIRCEATRNGTIHAAHAASGMVDLRGRFDEWHRLGEPVELLSREEMVTHTGTTSFAGGLLDHRAGTVNPMGYCRGLARAALGAGATIRTGVTVTGLSRIGEMWEVATMAGSVRAKHVVLGTNAYTDDLWPDLKRVFTTINYFQLATAPMGDRISHILPGHQGLWDTGRIMFSLRRDARGRLIIGSMGTVLGSAGQGISRRWAGKKLAQLFPDLGPVEFEEAWHGNIAMTPDHLPRIYELAPNLYTPIGYNGRGIITGTIFGECMADLITGMDPADLPLPITQLSTVPTSPVMTRLYRAAFTVNQFLKSI